MSLSANVRCARPAVVKIPTCSGALEASVFLQYVCVKPFLKGNCSTYIFCLIDNLMVYVLSLTFLFLRISKVLHMDVLLVPPTSSGLRLSCDLP